MKRLRLNLLLLLPVFAGCAAPITYFSRSPEPTKTGKVHFIAQGGAYSTIALFINGRDCTGIQRVAMYVPSLDQTVYVPQSKFITFSVYVQTPGVSQFSYGGGIYSVPFGSSELRIDVSHAANGVLTRIQELDPQYGWRPVDGVVRRQALRPFTESSPSCERSDVIG